MYCVYLTKYLGDKLPPLYIGSTSVEKIRNGYKGSVASLKYGSIWKEEINNNPDLFEVTILSEHTSREDALSNEYRLHLKFDVVKSPLFINQSNACVDGCFGMDVSGQLNPMYGVEKTAYTIESIRKANKGNMLVVDKCTGRYIKIPVGTFDERIHTRCEHSEEVRRVISENTSKSMSEKVSEGEHWFTSPAHRAIVSDMRKGVPRTSEERSNISAGRVESFKKQWLIVPYNGYDWNKVCEAVNWYDSNYVRRSRESSKTFRYLCIKLGLPEACIKWIMKTMTYEDSRQRLINVCINFLETQDEGSKEDS